MKHKILDRDSVFRCLQNFKEDIQKYSENDEDPLKKLYAVSGIITVDSIIKSLELLTYLEVDLPTEDINFGK